MRKLSEKYHYGMQNPTGVQVLRDFEDWKEKCTVKGQPYCSLPNPCPLTTRELPGETFRSVLVNVGDKLKLISIYLSRLHTCEECPNNYPWILDPTGDGFSFRK